MEERKITEKRDKELQNEKTSYLVDRMDCFAKKLPENLPDRREWYGTWCGVMCSGVLIFIIAVFSFYAFQELTEEVFVEYEEYMNISDNTDELLLSNSYENSGIVEDIIFYEHTIHGHFSVHDVIPSEENAGDQQI